MKFPKKKKGNFWRVGVGNLKLINKIRVIIK